MKMDLYAFLQANEEQQIQNLISCNKTSGQFGLTLTSDEAKALVISGQETLKEQERLELGEGILPRLIEAFCDSPYLTPENYTETLCHLQDIFYTCKNDTFDQLTDQELLSIMKMLFDGRAAGSVDYLAGTFMDHTGRSARAQRREDDWL